MSDADAPVDKVDVTDAVAGGVEVSDPVAVPVDVDEPVPVAVSDADAPVDTVDVTDAVAGGVAESDPVEVPVNVGVPVLVRLRVAVMDGCRMHTLTLVTASASCADGRTPMVMVCTPLFSKTRERVIQPVPPPSAMSAAEAFHST